MMMNSRRIYLLGIVVGTFLAGAAYAYKPEMHAEMARNALVQARGGIDFGARLGVDVGATFGGKTPIEWVAFGAEREDYPSVRSVNHFFDPVHDAPLTVGAWPFCTTTVSSPLGTVHTVRANAWALQSQPSNDWGLPKARDYQREVILGPNPGVRGQNVGFLFRSLGQIVHLVQDMGQPEHTRNDQHLFPIGAGADLYEQWSWANLIDSKIENADAYFTGYNTVVLPTFGQYFHDTDGRGMADYSNRNFVTQDTNYSDKTASKCFKYDAPELDLAVPRLVLVTEHPLDDNGVQFEQVLFETIYESLVFDAYTETTLTDGYHTVLSAFDAETKKYDPAKAVYSLNDSSYQTRAGLLVPRAVGYSAGLIDHFFRGRIDAQWQKLSTGPYAYELSIRNSGSEAIGPDAKLSLVYRATPEYFGRTNSDDTAVVFWNEPLASLVPGFAGIAPGETVVVHVLPVFGLKAGDSITQFERRIVIEGTLGAEQGSVISTVQDPTTKSGFVVEVKWSGDRFLSLAVEEFVTRIPRNVGWNDQVCYNPVNGLTCSDGVTMDNVTVERRQVFSHSVSIPNQVGCMT